MSEKPTYEELEQRIQELEKTVLKCKPAEEALIESEKEQDRLLVAIEQAAESVFITDRHGTIQYVNPAFERLTGYSREDAIGQNPRILKSGKQDALFYKQMWDTLARGHAWKGRFINRKKDGSFYEADATISPVLDKSGNITHFVSMKRDVTREIELEKRLIQAQKIGVHRHVGRRNRP